MNSATIADVTIRMTSNLGDSITMFGKFKSSLDEAKASADKMKASASDLEKGFESVSSDSKAVTDALDGMKRSLSEAEQGAEGLGDAFAALKSLFGAAIPPAKELSAAAQSIVDKQKALDGAVDQSTASLAELRTAYAAGEVSILAVARAEKELEDALEAAGRAQKEAKTSMDAFKEGAGALVGLGASLTAGVTLPIVGIASASVMAAGNLEQTKIAFTTMLGGAQQAGVYLEKLRDFAASTPFEFNDLTAASKKMLALGFSAQEVIPTLRIIGDTVAGLGGGAEMIDRVTLALGQMKAKGKVSAEEMRQLAEAGIPAWQALASQIGVSIPEAMKMAEKGAISAATAVPAILAGMNEKFSGLMEGQSKTLLGQWSNVKDQFGFILADLGSALLPFAKTVVDMAMPVLSFVKDAVKWFSELPGPIAGATIAVAALVAAIGPAIALVGGFGIAMQGVSAAAPALMAFKTLVVDFATVSVPQMISSVESFASQTLPNFIEKVVSSSAASEKLASGAEVLASKIGLAASASEEIAVNFGLAGAGATGLMGVLGVGLVGVLAAATLGWSDFNSGMAASREKYSEMDSSFRSWMNKTTDAATDLRKLTEAQKELNNALTGGSFANAELANMRELLSATTKSLSDQEKMWKKAMDEGTISNDVAGVALMKVASAQKIVQEQEKKLTGQGWAAFKNEAGLAANYVIEGERKITPAIQTIITKQSEMAASVKVARETLETLTAAFKNNEPIEKHVVTINDVRLAQQEYEKAVKSAAGKTTEAQKAFESFSKSAEVSLAKVPATYGAYISALSDGGQSATKILADVESAINKSTAAIVKMGGTPTADLQKVIDKLKDARARAMEFADADAWKTVNEAVASLGDEFAALDPKTQATFRGILDSMAKVPGAVARDGDELIKWLKKAITEQENLQKQTDKTQATLDKAWSKYKTETPEAVAVTVSLRDRLQDVREQFVLTGAGGETVWASFKTGTNEAGAEIVKLLDNLALIDNKNKGIKTSADDIVTAFENVATSGASQLGQVETYWNKVSGAIRDLAETNMPKALAAYDAMIDRLIKEKAPQAEINKLIDERNDLYKKGLENQKTQLEQEIAVREAAGKSAVAQILALDQIDQKLKGLNATSFSLGNAFTSMVNGIKNTLAETYVATKDILNRSIQSTSQAFSDLITDGGKFGDAMIGVLKNVEKQILDVFIGGVLKTLKKEIGDLIGSVIPSLGSSFSTGLGGLKGAADTTASAMKTASTATDAAANASKAASAGMDAVGGAGKAASTGISAATSSLMGTINMVAGIAGAIGSIAGAIGTFRLEGTMNAVEANTRFLEIKAEKFFEHDAWQMHEEIRQKFDMVYNRLGEMWQTLQSGFSGLFQRLGDVWNTLQSGGGFSTVTTAVVAAGLLVSTSVTSAAKTTEDAIQKTNTTLSDIQRATSDGAETAREMGRTLTNVNGTMRDVNDSVRSVGRGVADAAADAHVSLGDIARNVADNVAETKAVGRLQEGIHGTMRSVDTSVREVGRYVNETGGDTKMAVHDVQRSVDNGMGVMAKSLSSIDLNTLGIYFYAKEADKDRKGTNQILTRVELNQREGSDRTAAAAAELKKAVDGTASTLGPSLADIFAGTTELRAGVDKTTDAVKENTDATTSTGQSVTNAVSQSAANVTSAVSSLGASIASASTMTAASIQQITSAIAATTKWGGGGIVPDYTTGTNGEIIPAAHYFDAGSVQMRQSLSSTAQSALQVGNWEAFSAAIEEFRKYSGGSAPVWWNAGLDQAAVETNKGHYAQYAEGGWVTKTERALVHAGEFVISNSATPEAIMSAIGAASAVSSIRSGGSGGELKIEAHFHFHGPINNGMEVARQAARHLPSVLKGLTQRANSRS